MKRSTKRLSLLAVATVGVLAWPGPASADSALGGYSGSAQAIPLHIQVYEPVLPLPSNPQIDGGVAFTRSTTDTGPVSRALASYLWPGDVLGDGFNQLAGGDAKYPVQVNSRYPATKDAPASNTAQLTKGNGMTTSTTDSSVKASVTGLGVAGPDTDVLGGLLKGLDQLGGTAPDQSSKGIDVPVPVGQALAGLGTVQGVSSTSDVAIGSSRITTTAHARAGTIALLGGLIGVGGVNISGSTSSDGHKATASGSTTLGSITVAGMTFSFGDKGLTLGSSSAKVPALPVQLTSILKELGVELTTFTTHRSASGATSSYSATGLQFTVDTGTLKKRLGLSDLLDTVGQLLSKIPNAGDQLAPLLALGPKFVFTIGDVSTSATASPPYTGGSVPTGGATQGAGTSGGGSTGAGSTGSSAGGGSLGSTGGSLGSTGGSAPAGTGAAGPAATAPTATGYDLPGLGAVPKALILGGVATALLVAWLLSTAGISLFGAVGGCETGLATGVPDLRRG